MSNLMRLSQVLALTALLLPAYPVWSQMQTDMLKQSDIVFVGRVAELGAVSLPELTASGTTAVVSVEKVLQVPTTVTLVAGNQVTVDTAGTTGLAEGQRAVFFTQSWVFGDGIAVRLIGHESVPTGLTMDVGTLKEAEVAKRLQAQHEAELQERIEKADVIVVGRVKRVQSATLAQLAAPEQKFITEHDPDWREAVVEVESTLKGPAGMAEIVVRFPGSLDVAWYGYPKFNEGDEGTFLLHQDPLSGTPKAMLGTAEVNAYMATTRSEVRSRQDAERIRELMKAPK